MPDPALDPSPGPQPRTPAPTRPRGVPGRARRGLGRGAPRPAARGGVGAADRREGPAAQLRTGRRVAVLLQQGPHRPRRPDRARGGLRGRLVVRRLLPRLPPAAARVRRVHAARRRRRLPQGRRPGRRHGRRVPGRAGDRGRGGLRRAQLLAAARRRPVGPPALLGAPRGVRAGGAPQRRASSSAPPAPASTRTRRCTRPGIFASATSPPSSRPRASGPTGSCSTCSRRGSASTRSRTRWCRAASSASTSRPPPSSAGWSRRCARTAASPSPSRGRRCCASGTPRAWPCAPATDAGPHRVPGHRPPDGAGGAGPGQEASPGARCVREGLQRPAAAGAAAAGRGGVLRLLMPAAARAGRTIHQIVTDAAGFRLPRAAHPGRVGRIRR